jgi:protein transport protein SEC24
VGQMGIGQQQPAAQPQQAAARPAVLNQLYPTDLLNQPFNVAELELPPPPIILPPNVSSSNSLSCGSC